MSMMLLEAASVKTPIICSDIIENRDVFNEAEVLFFSLDIKEDLEKKIEWALNNNAEMQQKAEKAYEHIVNTNNWQSISKNYLNLYNQLMNK